MSSTCPSSRWGHVAVAIDDRMLLWGGKATREATGEKFYCSSDRIECLNLETSEWSRKRAISKIADSDVPHPCVHAQVGVVGNNIYQFGGVYNSSYDGLRLYFDDIHKLNGSTLEWECIRPSDHSTTPTGRRNHGMCVLGKKGDECLVVMGGFGTETPEGSHFIPYSKYPDRGWNNDAWLFSLRKRIWISVRCTGESPQPRSAHSLTTIDTNRAVLIGGSDGTRLFNDIFVFQLSSMEWIQVYTDGPHRLLPLSGHSTTVAHIPGLGQCAIVLWGETDDNAMVSFAQLIFIDSLQCYKVALAHTTIRTAFQSMCSLLRDDVLFLLRFGGTNDFKTWKPVALLDILKFDLKSDGLKSVSGTSSSRVPISLEFESCSLPCQIADPHDAE